METPLCAFQSSRITPLKPIFLQVSWISVLLIGLLYLKNGKISEDMAAICIGASFFLSSLHAYKNWKMALFPLKIDVFRSGMRINNLEIIPWEILVPTITEDQISFVLNHKHYKSYDIPFTGIDKLYINRDNLAHFCRISFQEIIRRDPSFVKFIMEINRVTGGKYISRNEDPREPRRLKSKPKWFSVKEIPGILFAIYIVPISLYPILGTIFIPSTLWVIIGILGNAMLIGALLGYNLWLLKKGKRHIPLFSSQKKVGWGIKYVGGFLLMLSLCYLFMIGGGKILNMYFGHEVQKELVLKSDYTNCFSSSKAFAQKTCFSGIYDSFGREEVTVRTSGRESFFGYFPEKFFMPDQTERTGDGKFIYRLKSFNSLGHETDVRDKTP